MKRIIFILAILAFGVTFATQANAAVVHVVVKGECLSKIARENNISLEKILTMNPKFKSNPSLIHPGDKIVIAEDFVVVKKGDWLSKIARRFDTTVDALLVLNPQIEDPDRIFPGEIIRLTNGSVAKAEPKKSEFVDPFTKAIEENEKLGPFVGPFAIKNDVSKSSHRINKRTAKDTKKIAKAVSRKNITKKDLRAMFEKAGVPLNFTMSKIDTEVLPAVADVINTDSIATPLPIHKNHLILFVFKEMRPVFLLGVVLFLFMAMVIKGRK